MSAVKQTLSERWRSTIRPVLGQLRWPVCALVLLVACIASGVAVNNSAQQMRTLYQDLGKAQSQQDALQEQHSRLLLEKSFD